MIQRKISWNFIYKNIIRTEMLRKHIQDTGYRIQDTEKELSSIIIWRSNMLDE